MRNLLILAAASLSIQAFASIATVTLKPVSPIIQTTDLIIKGNPDVLVPAPYFLMTYSVKADADIEVQSLRVNVITPDGKKMKTFEIPLSPAVEITAGAKHDFDSVYISDLPFSRELEYEADLTIVGREKTEAKSTSKDLARVFFDTW